MEYRFELALCAALESPDRVVARQLGSGVTRPGARIVDVCVLRPGPDFDARAAISPDRIPATAIEAAVGPGEAVPVAEAFDCSPERATDVVDAAVDAGYLERERRHGRDVVRATARYPTDWIGSLTAIENKPDLGQPGDLAAQLRYDVALGLFDTVVLATASYVTRAHLNRIPDPVGVWRFDAETGDRDVVREATPLSPAEPGVEIREERALRTDVSLVAPAAKTRKRRRIGERAYGKGWRPSPPACTHAQTTADGRPYCGHFDRVVDPSRECGGDCPAFASASPPPLDRDRLRASHSAWVADADAGPRRQAGLSQFE